MDYQHIPFGIDGNGSFRDVDEVPRGFECGCVCPDCKGPLNARQGDIKVHHFAHQDRRDCRSALDASVYGMLMTIVRQPGASLRVPPNGWRRDIVPNPGAIFTASQQAEFFKTPWLIEGKTVALASADLADPDINKGNPAEPEIKLPTLHVHILAERRKTRDDVLTHGERSGVAVLLLDLKAYRKLWWEICDPHKEQTVRAAGVASRALSAWLTESDEGREWVFHPELALKRRKLHRWIAEKSAVAAANGTQADRRRQGVQRSPMVDVAPPAATADGHVMVVPSGDASAVAYLRPVKQDPWLTTHMAAEFGLMVTRATNGVVFIGRPGMRVPTIVAELLDTQAEWRPLSESDLAQFVSARDAIRRTLEQYGVQSPSLPK